MDLKEKETEAICTGTFGSSCGILCSRLPEWISATGLCGAGAVRNREE